MEEGIVDASASTDTIYYILRGSSIFGIRIKFVFAHCMDQEHHRTCWGFDVGTVPIEAWFFSMCSVFEECWD